MTQLHRRPTQIQHGREQDKGMNPGSHGSLMTTFGDLLSEVPNHLGFNNTYFFLHFLFSYLTEDHREAVLRQCGNPWSHSRVRRGTPEFSQAARAQGDPMEGKAMERMCGQHSNIGELE